MMSNPDWGAALKILRVARKLTQEDVASGTDFDKSYISLLEHGSRTPSLEAVGRLCSVLRVSHSDLVRIAEDPPAALGIAAA
ncbi:MAG: helix-turn-helix transcriptional regulator [Acidobacteria bacterium]|nr:helix-turn-helix transcriptional regulator [Acidobacteriota bacterium]